MRKRSQEAKAAAVERTKVWRKKHPYSYDKQKARYVTARKRRRAWKRELIRKEQRPGIEVDL
jgi:hypothetical protein